jgi:hypothetical protein
MTDINQRRLSHMTYGTDMTFDQRLAKIDLTKVMARVQDKLGVDDATCARAEDLYRKWLTLRFKNPTQVLVPPVLVDYVWEGHQAYSRQYMADTEMLFGSFLHHNPLDGDTTELYETGTVDLFEKEYGIALYAYGVPAELMVASQCGC